MGRSEDSGSLSRWRSPHRSVSAITDHEASELLSSSFLDPVPGYQGHGLRESVRPFLKPNRDPYVTGPQQAARSGLPPPGSWSLMPTHGDGAESPPSWISSIGILMDHLEDPSACESFLCSDPITRVLQGSRGGMSLEALLFPSLLVIHGFGRPPAWLEFPDSHAFGPISCCREQSPWRRFTGAGIIDQTN